MLHSAMQTNGFTRDTSFSDLEDQSGLDTGTVLAEKADLVLAESLCSSSRAQSQSDSAHKVLSKRTMKNAMRVLDNFLDLGPHRHVFCLSVVFLQENRNLRALTKNGENMEGDLKGEKKKLSKAFEVN